MQYTCFLLTDQPSSSPRPSVSLARLHQFFLSTVTMESMLQDIKNIVLYDKDVQEGRVSQRMNITYSQFCTQEDRNETATRKCIGNPRDLQKNLPDHLQTPQHLLTQFCDVFRHILWCSTLYQDTDLHEDAASFAQKLVSAAASFDLAQKSRPDGDTHHFSSGFYGSPSASELNDLVAFFAKTPLLSRDHHPFCFRRDHPRHPSYNRNQSYPRRQHNEIRLRRNQLFLSLRRTSTRSCFALCAGLLVTYSETVQSALSTNSSSSHTST